MVSVLTRQEMIELDQKNLNINVFWIISVICKPNDNPQSPNEL